MKKLNKGILFGFGAVTAAVAPVAAVVACGSKSDDKKEALSGKLESLKQLFTDAKLTITDAQIKEFEAKFGKDAEYEFDAVNQTGSTTTQATRHLVLIRHHARLSEAEAKAQADALATSWNAGTTHTDKVAGTDTFGPINATSWKGATLTATELKDFAYTFETNENGHIRVRAIIEKSAGVYEQYDRPVFAIDLTPVK